MTRRPPVGRVLPRRFFARPTLDVARDLLGKVLVHRTPDGTTAGIIVEAEAYVGESDPACHAASGPTRRNAPLYGPPGHAYVYFNYGMHWLVNAVTEPEGMPAAVLIRALAPTDGLALMRARRGRRRDGHPVPDEALCRGPGNVTKAMGIGSKENLADLTRPGGTSPDAARKRAASSALWIEDRGMSVPQVAWTARVGISVGTERAWRCVVPGHPAVSAGRARPRARAGFSSGSAAPAAARGRGTPPSVPRGRPRS